MDERAGTFSINTAKVKDAVRKLTHDILTLQAEGSYEKAKAMLDKYAVVRPQMQKALDRLGDVPVDIEPSFPMAHEKTRSFKTASSTASISQKGLR
jgi:uncharacterized protein YjbJ (UPF0337 family)